MYVARLLLSFTITDNRHRNTYSNYKGIHKNRIRNLKLLLHQASTKRHRGHFTMSLTLHYLWLFYFCSVSAKGGKLSRRGRIRPPPPLFFLWDHVNPRKLFNVSYMAHENGLLTLLPAVKMALVQAFAFYLSQVFTIQFDNFFT